MCDGNGGQQGTTGSQDTHEYSGRPLGPVAGRVGYHDVEMWLPRRRGQMHYLSYTKVEVRQGEWSKHTWTDGQGYFAFSEEELEGRAVSELQLWVYARAMHRITVGHVIGEPSGTGSNADLHLHERVQPFGFFVEDCGPDMTVRVPDYDAPYQYVDPERPSLKQPLRTLVLAMAGGSFSFGGTAGVSDWNYPARTAFCIYLILRMQRAWYWWECARHAPESTWVRELFVLIPRTEGASYFARSLRVQAEDGAFRTTDAICITTVPFLGEYSDIPFSISSLCHEFGHHVWYCCGLRGAVGSHQWRGIIYREDLTPGDEDDREHSTSVSLERLLRTPQLLLHQLAVDLAEAYASYIGQMFLRDSRYMFMSANVNMSAEYHLEQNIYPEDLERPQVIREGGQAPNTRCTSFGDAPTAGYLWDLSDVGNAGDEPFEASFLDIHMNLLEFARAQGSRYLTLPAFHEWLVEHLVPGKHLHDAGHGPAPADRPGDRLSRLIGLNGLDDAFSGYRRIPAEERDSIEGRRAGPSASDA